MKTERLTLAGVAAALLLTATAMLVPSLTLGFVDWHSVFELLLWGTTALFAATALAWVVLTYVVGAGYEPPDSAHGGDEIQVRILTVDAEDVVQATVDSLPADLDDVHVVAETDIDVEGAAVHVVPDDFSFELSTTTCRNEAPPSLTEITQQRRRWAAGNLRAATTLPPGYQLLTRVRNYAWALSPVVTLVVVPLSVLGVGVAAGGLFALTSFALGLCTLFWYLRGVSYYGADKLQWALAVPLAPLVTVVHSMGTVVGILDPPEGFRVTKKVGGS